MLIECDTCAVRGRACRDCVVTVLLELPPAPRYGGGGAADEAPAELAERRAVTALVDGGLVSPHQAHHLVGQRRGSAGSKAG